MKFYPLFADTRMDALDNHFFVTAPENLVFSGGGIKGLAYLGVVKALEEKHLAEDIKGYAGASAGAIIAALLAIGMKADELNRHMMALDYNLFLKRSNVNVEALAENPRRLLDPRVGGVVAFDEVMHKGLCDGSFFTKWLTRLFVSKGFNAHTTYKELYERNKKVLKIVLCNVNFGKTVIASHENTPKMPVIASVRASMAIPFIYWPFEWEGDLYVDGGTMYNYPIELFDKECSPEKTLGFLLTAEKQILNPERKDDQNLWQHIARIYEALMNVDNDYCFRMGNQKRTVFIDAKGMDILEFNASNEEKENLAQEGYRATIHYFSQ